MDTFECLVPISQRIYRFVSQVTQACETYAFEFREVSEFEHGQVREVIAIFVVSESKTEPQNKSLKTLTFQVDVAQART